MKIAVLIMLLTANLGQCARAADGPNVVDYDGPMRFKRDALSRIGPAIESAPLTSEGAYGRTQTNRVERADQSQIAQRLEQTILESVPSKKSLMAEVAALDAAGYRGVVCTYGPYGPQNGYAPIAFWFERRPPMSNELIASIQNQVGVDVAINRCPVTLGEARDIALGRITAPARDVLFAQEDEKQKRLGVRLFPLVPGIGQGPDPRLLAGRVLVSPVAIMDVNGEQGSRANWQQNPGVIGSTILRLDDSKQQVLLCNYAQDDVDVVEGVTSDLNAYSPAGESTQKLRNVTRVRFWYRSRPEDISTTFLKNFDRGELLLIDLARDDCPGSYLEVYAMVNGDANALAAAKQVTARGKGNVAAQPNTDAEDEALFRRIREALVAIEYRGDQLPAAEYGRIVTNSIRPALTTLSASVLARARSIPAGASGRGAFDAWERTYGGPLLTVIRRTYLIARSGAFRMETQGISLRDLDRRAGPSQQREKEDWANAAAKQLFTRPVYRDLMTVYATHIPSTTFLDPAFMEKTRSAALSAASERDRNTTPRSTRTSSTVTIFGTPSEIAATRLRMQIGETVQAVGELKQNFAELNARVIRTRAAFWACYASRCAGSGSLYLDYSVALRDKDLHYLYLSAYMAGASQTMGIAGPGLGMFLTMLGSGGVDNGIVLGCESAADSFTAVLGQDIRANGIANAYAAFERASARPEYVTYQTCRDRQEYVFRNA